jgi:hypothetical protein
MIKEITSWDEPWDDGTHKLHDGEDIENFLRKSAGEKFGHVTYENGVVTLYDKEGGKQMAQFDVSGATGVDTLTLRSKQNVNEPIVSLNGTMVLQLQVVSSAMLEYVDVEVFTSSTDDEVWTKRGSFSMPSVSAESSAYMDIDLTEFLTMGEQRVRLRGTGRESGAVGSIGFANVMLSLLSLSFQTDWRKAQTNGNISLAYYINGAIEKSLHIKVDGRTVFDGSVGKGVYNEVPYSRPVPSTLILTHGVHKVEAYLYVTGDASKHTEPLFNEIFVQADETDTKPYIVVNDIATEAQPYVDTDLFKYAIFANVERVPFIVKGLSADGSVAYLSDDRGDVQTGVITTYRNSFNVDSTDATIAVHVFFYTRNERGEEVLLKADYSPISLDNSNNFAPTEMLNNGVIINPKNRSNAQANAQSIINEKTGAVIPSTWQGFDMLNDGWVDNCLRVKAGSLLTIDLNVLGEDNVTIEFDMMVYNLHDYAAESEAVVTLGRDLDTDGKVLGLKMLPLRAHLLTQSKRNINVQDIQWQEGVRTHIAINKVRNLGNSGLNYLRFLINGVINREFRYGLGDVFSRDGDKLVIGSTSADIDIYGIRIYRQALSSQQVMQDYKAAIPNAADKLEFARKNDIVGDDNTISYEKSQTAGYSTIRIIPDDPSKNALPNYTNKGNNISKATVEILVRNADGSLNTRYCQRITHIKLKGQGTSSMTYLEWNQTMTATETSERYTMNENYDWVYDESVSGEDCFFILPNGKSGKADVKFVKGVGKVNWASSMQSHKMGWCNIYTDMYWAIGKQSGINKVEGYENARKSVTQMPFLFFVGNDFKSPMTFGPAKYDKFAFGTKAASPNYMKGGKAASIFTALEGSANGRVLPERKIPWLRDEVFYFFNPSTDDDRNECLVYNDEAQLDVDKAVMQVFNEGTDDEYEIPCGFTRVAGSTSLWQETEDTEFDTANPYKVVTGNTIKFYRRAYNHDYLHNPRLAFVSGTYQTLLDRANDLDKSMQYWVTQGSNAYDLYRWNPLTETWVNAGAAKDASTEDGYARLNLMEQCNGWFTQYGITFNPNDPVQANNAFIAARVADYKATSVKWYNEEDCRYDQAFRKFAALKDNWCKNTYESLQPDGLISMDSDDNDTSGDLDNVGASKCPYYAEEHDRCDTDGNFDPEGGGTYWNSDTNVRFCLQEQANGEELAEMTKQLMDAMASRHGSVMEAMEAYMFSTQRYYPAAVYNEQARLFYERADVMMSRGEYTNNTDPLSQCLGDHLQSELEFWKKRIAYIGSWCRSNEYLGGDAGAGSFSFRTASADSTYQFRVTAHQAIYPAMRADKTLLPIRKVRMLPSDTVTLDRIAPNTQDINVFLSGVDYYSSIGSLTGMGISNEVLNVSGKRLVDFVADGADGKFATRSIVFNTPRMQRVYVTDVPTMTGSLDLSACANVREIVLTGNDGITGVTLPNTKSVTKMLLPKNLLSLDIANYEDLTEFGIEGVDALTSVSIEQSADVVAHEFYTRLAEAL